MTNIKFKLVKIGSLFDFPSTNSKITKEYCNSNQGKIPVYASSKSENSVLGYIQENLPKVKYYSNCLSWNRNGSVGYVFIRDHKFATNEDHRAMTIKNEYNGSLDPLYLKFEIEKKLLLGGFSFLNKCGVSKIKKVEISIPIDKLNKYDLEKQKELAKKYNKFKNLRSNITSIYQNIFKLKIQLEKDYKTKEFLISDLFDRKKGNAKYTKSHMRSHKGTFPIYSSQTTNDGEIGQIDSFDYNLECLTWTTDGIYAGTVFYRNGKFSMTTHCGALILKETYVGLIDLKYIQYQLNLHLKDFAIGEGNKRLTIERISKVPIKIIVDMDGKLNLIKQKEIAKKYFKIQEIKQHIKENYEGIIQSEINF